jgi:protein-S-isoprenylcysteine O-methyltransferase Ste14
MSLLNPAPNTTESLPSPVLGLGHSSLSMLISASMLVLGISRVGPSALVEDLHAGGFGLYLIVASYLAFVAVTLFVHPSTPSELKTSGIFKFTRNPAYLAFFLPLATLGYFSLETAAASIVIYVTAMNLTVIRKEEQDMHNALGEVYSNYRNAVPRWFA